MAKTISKKTRATDQTNESDGTYLLKIVLYIILGSFWLRFAEPVMLGPIVLHAFPLGLCIGLLFASHDHFQVDRKIEYVILIIATIFSFFIPSGIIL